VGAPYGADLAHVHDEGFTGFARDSAPGLLRILREGGVRGGLVADLGCGTGVWAQALVAAGYRAFGTDLSPAMVRLARARVPQGRFQVGSFVDVPFPACDAITALGEVFSYRFDARHDTRALPRLFRRLHAALRPGGLLVFDLAEPGRGAGPPPSHRIGADWAVTVDFEEDARRRELTRYITTFRKHGEIWRRSDEVHKLRLHRAADVAAVLRRCGFRARVLRGYGAYRFPPHYAAVRARRI